MSAWVVFGLATLPFRMQVRFHDDIDESSLARAIYASTGPLLFPLIQGFSHTHTPHPHRPHRREIYLLLREVFAALDQRRCFGEFCQEPGFKSWTPSGISSHPWVESFPKIAQNFKSEARRCCLALCLNCSLGELSSLTKGCIEILVTFWCQMSMYTMYTQTNQSIQIYGIYDYINYIWVYMYIVKSWYIHILYIHILYIYIYHDIYISLYIYTWTPGV